MNIKVAIMTWYTYRNYGTVLQASALYHKVRELGYAVDLIKYMPRPGRSKKTVRSLQREVLSKAKAITNKAYSSEKHKKLFAEYLEARVTETKECDSYVDLEGLTCEYDAFLCGSDQIWSPLNFDEKYFLPFVSDSNKKIAYAPSFGTSKIDDPIIKERISEHVNSFEHLSTRELQGAELIKSMTGKAAKVVLDPTLLMTTDEWNAFADTEKKENRISGDYIICYFLGEYKKYMRYVRLLSKTMGIPYYVIPVKQKQKNAKGKIPFEVGPSEFVSLIKNATHVCTDSFHGLVFATNYEVPFSVFKRFKDNDLKNQNSRILSFLSLLSLENRLVDPKESNVLSMLTCDFSSSKEKLEMLRKDSLVYLKDSLEKATQLEPGMSKKQYKITEMCCGCGACVTACGSGAIRIMRNSEGFQHFQIDYNKCVRCGLCKSVCPMNKLESVNLRSSMGLYAAKSNSSSVLKVSSSGGVAHELSKYFQQVGAYVCGCMYDKDLNIAKHIVVEPDQKDDLRLLQGSKYIQSDTQGVMAPIVNITKNDKLIFFGTPCQCAAVDKICKKHNTRDNVYIVDLICHGVPSYHLWSKYLYDLNSRYSIGTNPEVLFRSNDGRWNLRTIAVKGNGAIYREKEHRDDFYAFFRRGLCDMRSCSECPYRQTSSADLRIGDFWGARFKKDKEGVSMIIAINERGMDLIDILRENTLCKIQEFPLEDYWKIQAPYNHNPSLSREQLIEELKENKKTLSQLRKDYCRYYDLREGISKIYQTALQIINK